MLAAERHHVKNVPDRAQDGRARRVLGLGLVTWLAPIAFALPLTVSHHRSEPHPSWHPLWEWLGLTPFLILFAFGTVAALLALGAAALPRRQPVTDANPAV